MEPRQLKVLTPETVMVPICCESTKKWIYKCICVCPDIKHVCVYATRYVELNWRLKVLLGRWFALEVTSDVVSQMHRRSWANIMCCLIVSMSRDYEYVEVRRWLNETWVSWTGCPMCSQWARASSSTCAPTASNLSRSSGCRRHPQNRLSQIPKPNWLQVAEHAWPHSMEKRHLTQWL